MAEKVHQYLENVFDSSHQLGSNSISRDHGDLEGAVSTCRGTLGHILTGQTQGAGA